MPSEHREIGFAPKEIIDALANLNLAGRFLPSGEIIDIKFMDLPGGVAGVVVVKPSTGGDPVEYTTTPERLAAALINYCRAHKIPLPRNATKRLVRQAESVTLHVDLAG